MHTVADRTGEVSSETGAGGSREHLHEGRAARAIEAGGPAGPEPTRYGDWERKGRCIDF